MFDNSKDYYRLMLTELQRLENLSDEYKVELRYLSKVIRRDFWTKYNTNLLCVLLNKINNVYESMMGIVKYFDLSCIFEYIKILQKYCGRICPTLDALY